jgi:putative cell wall-binding protein
MHSHLRFATVATVVAIGLVVVGMGSVRQGPHAYAAEYPLRQAPGVLSTGAFTESEVVEAPFTLAALTWLGEASGEIAYRVHGASGWSAWREIHVDADHAPDPGTAERRRQRYGTEPVFVGEQDRIQFRFDGAIPDGARASLIDTTTRTQPIIEQVVGMLAPTSADAAPARPGIRPRSDWDPEGQCAPRTEPEEIQVVAAVVHHTGIDRAYSQGEVPGILLGYCLYHRDSRGWDDVAYNLFVDRFGTVWEGRAGGVDKGIRGGHTSGFSSYTTGIALIGNYVTGSPSSAQMLSLERLLGWKLGMHNVDPLGTVRVVSKGSYKYPEGAVVTMPTISGHSDLQSTACPGPRLYAQLPQLRSAVGAVWRPDPDHYESPVIGNFSGSSDEDGAVYRPSDGSWTVTDGATGATTVWLDGSDGLRVTAAVAADLDGDGRDSIIARSGSSVKELTSRGASFSEAGTRVLAQSGSAFPPVVGDFAGSGAEAVAFVSSSGSVEVVTSAGIGTWGSLGPGQHRVVAGDFDGDGRTDIAGFADTGRVVVARSLGTSFAPASTWTDIAPDSGWQFVLSGDFDGNGTDDIAAFHESSQTWHTLRSTTTSFAHRGSATLASKDHWSAAFSLDGDGDGTDEVVALDAHTGAWHLGRFAEAMPAFVLLEDAPYRTTVRRPSADGRSAPFLSWFGQEASWISTRLGWGLSDESNATQRVYGASKYATSAAVSRLAFTGADVVYVATGEQFPDALAGGSAAVRAGAPVLLTSRNGLDGAVADELRRLRPREIVVIGGPAAISDAVVAQLAQLAPGGTTRLGGADRYETAALVSKSSFPAQVDTVFIATGLNFPDALSGVPAAGRSGAPILLVREHVPVPTATELRRLAPKRIVILGGPAAVSPDVEAELSKYAGTVQRVAGHDRYATAAAVAKAAYPEGARTVFIAIGTQYPDAVGAGPAAHALGGPLLLVDPDAAPGTTLSELRRLRPQRIVVLGGEGVVADEVIDAMDGIGEGAATRRLARLPLP